MKLLELQKKSHVLVCILFIYFIIWLIIRPVLFTEAGDELVRDRSFVQALFQNGVFRMRCTGKPDSYMNQ